MKMIPRRQFVQHAAMGSAALLTARIPGNNNRDEKKPRIKFRLLRHASLLVEVAGKKILVDPMLSKKEAMEPVPNAANANRVPLVDLPVTDVELAEILQEVEAVMVTHLHRDHWDPAAREQISKDKLIICQPSDEATIKSHGFLNVHPVNSDWRWNDIQVHRTNGQHGTGETGRRMGIVSGYVIEYKNDRVYIAGDTIWCSDVQDAINLYQPTSIIVNGGGAQFLQGGPITMTTDDVLKLAQFTKAGIAVVHLESINHCYQRRSDFKKLVMENDLVARVHIPADGEWIIV